MTAPVRIGDWLETTYGLIRRAMVKNIDGHKFLVIFPNGCGYWTCMNRVLQFRILSPVEILATLAKPGRQSRRKVAGSR